MNLLDLAVKIGVDDQASDKCGEIGQKLGDGLKSAAKVGIAAVTAASAAIVSLAKQSIDAYAEYEQLVGGVDTLFKNSSQKLQAYAADAYKTAGMSANQYMSVATSFSASLLQGIAGGVSAVSEETTAMLTAMLEEQLEALEDANAASVEALEESHDAEIAAYRQLTDEKIALIDRQYMEQLRLVDEERYNQLKAIDEEIAAIESMSEAEDKAAEEKERNEKKAALQLKIETASNARFRKAAEKELSDYLAQIEKEDAERARKQRVEELKSQKASINEEADLKKQALEEQRDTEVKAVEEESDKQLEAMKKRQKKELSSLKAANKEKLEEMEEYISQQTEYLSQASSDLIEYTSEHYELAAEYANMAITDMADNANKMGTSMEMIQNAYQGFAKQNYTMLDNLKLGYGGTKEEMERLIEDANKVKVANGEMADLSINSFADVVEAIHIVQTEMGITGTTTKEASETISGSTASMKAAWENLKTGIADENAEMDVLIGNFVLSAETAADNILERVFETIEGIKGLFSDPEQRQQFIELGKTILDKIVEGLTGDEYAEPKFSYILGWLTGSLYEIVSDAINAAWDWFKSGGLVGAIAASENFGEDFTRGLMQGSETLRTSGMFSWGNNSDRREGPAAGKSTGSELSGTLLPTPGTTSTVGGITLNNTFNVYGTDEESAKRMAGIIADETARLEEYND